MAAGTLALSTSTGQTKAINPSPIAITVTLATFMELLDTAIANVSLPIAGGLATSYDESTWVSPATSSPMPWFCHSARG